MPISINKDSINFGTYSISTHPDGIEIDGVFKYASNKIIVPVFQGVTSGYTSGGRPSAYDTIDKFPFATDTNATDVGNLATGRFQGPAGQSSGESGYTSGGRIPAPTAIRTNAIEKFPFATDGDATDVGDLTQGRSYVTGASNIENGNGYSSGGISPSTNIIDKFPFASDANATDVGNLLTGQYGGAGQSSDVQGYGYVSGGRTPPSATNSVIRKFSFTTDGNSTNVGDLTDERHYMEGQSSDVSGYASGGSEPAKSTIIDKFPFATDANATDVGDLLVGVTETSGQSSKTNGYVTGGNTTSPSGSNVIQKFSFASDGNSTDVADLTATALGATGQQV